MPRILVIDDDESVRSTLEEMLVRDGHTVATAENGLKGVELFRARPFDVVITDIIMDEQEGLETIMALRHEAPGVGVIAMSGGSGRSPFYLQMAARLGADHTLAKPFAPADIREALRTVAAKRPPAAD